MADWAALDAQALAQGVAVSLLLLLRLLPLAWLVPWAQVRSGPAALPLALTSVLAICLWPGAAATAPQLPLSLPALLALGLRELLIGVVYALALALPLCTLHWAGLLQGRFSGIIGGEAAYGSLLLWLGLAAFVALGGHRLAVAALAEGFIRHPLGVLQPAQNISALALGSARLLSDAFAAAVQIALPVAAAIGVFELALALVFRSVAAPALALAFAPARALVGMFVVWIGGVLLLSSFSGFFAASFAAAKRLWEAL